MISMEEAARATGGRWLTNPFPLDTPLRGGAFDTRKLGDAQIFFALKGEQADGHDYLSKLAGTPVKLAVVHREASAPGFQGALLLVDDTLAALAALGRFLIDKHRPKVVAVTGSYGKTTAKEMMAHVLAGTLTVLKTPGSLNNDIGLPMTLLGLDGSQQAAVLEFAARHPGDIERLGRVAPPDVAVLMNVGRAHIGVFGSQEAIYQTKAEIFTHLRPGGTAVVFGGDPRLIALAQELKNRGVAVLTFGAAGADFQAEQLETDAEGCQVFTGVRGNHRVDFRSAIPGPHGHLVLLAAWAVATVLGVPETAVAERASHHPGQKGRAVMTLAPGGALVVDDSYNASPETVVNLIRTLETIQRNERVLVLGHLSELDGWEEQAMELIGSHLGGLTRCLVLDPQRPATVGDLARHTGPGVVEGLPTMETLIQALRGWDRPGVALGVKGSRSAHMERAVLAMARRRVGCALVRCGLLISCADCPKLSG
ncbi:MAG: UDP-N-acetylmuramoyl-tripeptide--D-alanyl-D-alanine ligase [Deltaproteobacteria bacterium]|nr:UDP-N-acetylmuramoyl-tripeptide--D-alanyl-D-alanine ligase [Deltaproteobacteria bacterium]